MKEKSETVNTFPKHRWKVLGIGVVANASFSMIIGGLPAAGVLLRSSYMLTNSTLGFIFSMMGLGVALSELPWGMVTDKWGDRPVLLTGLSGTAIIALLMSFFAVPSPTYIPSVFSLTLFVLAMGLIGSSVNGSSGRAIMSWFTDAERGFAMSIRQTAVPMGYGLGALLFPYIALHFGFKVLYSFAGIVLFVCAFFTWLWLHEPNITKGEISDKKSVNNEVISSPLKRFEMWKIVTAIGILCAPQFVLLTFGAVFLHDFGHVSVYVSSISLAIIQVGAMIIRIWSGRWTDRNKNRKIYLKSCAILSTVAFIMLALSNTLLPRLVDEGTTIFSIVLILLFILSGVLVSAWHGVAYTELASMAGSKYVATALAMGNSVVFIVLFLTPLVVPYLTIHYSWTEVWIVSIICSIYAYICFPKSTSKLSKLKNIKTTL
ncbi:MFS transporter [Vibrio spartinae]|uniref:Major Facilitator Superfamily protein n=1 Tax=Vibrio spartinae TaxID=1918945 RepID=A0A1N6MBY3_9VIBR|nr:MFS transporter [Vibrio spartinae]SIO96890.1 Major Facilitator Superfamily protein [Vibrio spartinae]